MRRDGCSQTPDILQFLETVVLLGLCKYDASFSRPPTIFNISWLNPQPQTTFQNCNYGCKCQNYAVFLYPCLNPTLLTIISKCHQRYMTIQYSEHHFGGPRPSFHIYMLVQPLVKCVVADSRMGLSTYWSAATMLQDAESWCQWWTQFQRLHTMDDSWLEYCKD